MQRMIHRQRLATTLLALTVVAAALGVGEADARSRLRISVSDGAGHVALAHLSCGGRPAASGWLRPRARAGCRTARRLLPMLRRRRPPRGSVCSGPPAGRERATIRGTIAGRRVARVLHRRDSCAEADWVRARKLLAGAFSPVAPPATGAPTTPLVEHGGDDAVVVAAIDFGLNPYHWDFLASRMPQQGGDPADDLPLHRPPHEWLAGFPDPSAFRRYEPLNLRLEEHDADADPQELAQADEAEWRKVKGSDWFFPSLYWIPGTKVIGALAGGKSPVVGPTSTHGTGVASAAVGAINGACPECLLVFIDLTEVRGHVPLEAAIDWVQRQPWIDAMTVSWELGSTGRFRDNVYAGSDLGLQRAAVERGQSLFYLAGNGLNNDGLVPGSTLLSSQKGPDWVVTVGGVLPGTHASSSGANKPVDIAGIVAEYPSAYRSPTVGGQGKFNGTSNATPTIAGTYARALHRIRNGIPGAGRVQAGGVIAPANAPCGPVRPACELADGALTGGELRRRLFLGAERMEPGLGVGSVTTPPTDEEELLAEGYGTYTVMENGREEQEAELARILGPLTGAAPELDRPEGEAEWFIADSFCRQHLWGAWNGGDYIDGATTLPPADPAWPIRALLTEGCPKLPPQH